MKRIIFLIIASLLVLGLVLPGCGPGVPARPQIIIGVPAPLGDIQGVHMVEGAKLAAAEINAAGGVNVTVGGNSTIYDIIIKSRNTNEIANPMAAHHAVEWLITTGGAQFIIGGFRTEAVRLMIDNVIKDKKVPFFVCGAAAAGLLAGFEPYGDPKAVGTPYYPYNATSDYYKYVFRATPFNDRFLLGMVMSIFAQITQQIQSTMGWTWTGTGWNITPVRVAVVGENLTWAAPIIGGYGALLAGFGGLFGWNHTITRTFGDNAEASEIRTHLEAIQAAKTHVILTCMSGKVGETFGKEMRTVNVTAIPVGINVEAQGPNYWINTGGGAQYEVVTGTWAPGVNNTHLTAGFIERYKNATGMFPIYTAASYDMVYSLKEAIEATDSLDKDVLVPYLETATRITTSGRSGYYPKWDGTTVRTTLGTPYPALNDSQVADIYPAGWYVPSPGFNYTMPGFTTHDIIFGPRTNATDPNTGWMTGIAVQWQNVTGVGTQMACWPKAGFDAPYGPMGWRPQSTMTRRLSGLNWSNEMEYPGTAVAIIPAAYQSVWAGWTYP